MEPYIWLNEAESVGDATCGCKVVEEWNGSVGAAYFQCKLHAAAGELLAACKGLLMTIGLHAGPTISPKDDDVVAAQQAIAKAERK